MPRNISKDIILECILIHLSFSMSFIFLFFGTDKRYDQIHPAFVSHISRKAKGNGKIKRYMIISLKNKLTIVETVQFHLFKPSKSENYTWRISLIRNGRKL